jgi:hypothetical protein
MSFDPRTIGASVYDALKGLRGDRTKDDPLVKKQKSQAVELYTYLSTWGMLRLKAEEMAMKDKNEMKGKLQVIEKFFACLKKLSETDKNLASNQGLISLSEMDVSDYLGLTGLGLAIAREFSFWATAVYHDVSGDD